MQTRLARLNHSFLRTVLASLAGAALLISTPASAEILVKDGQKVAFMGDSITQGGWGSPGGYVRLVVAGLEANGVKGTPIPAGISGHKSDQMLARLKKDALDKQPDWMTLSCGVNDVWHGARGIPLDQYKTNITTILDQCAAAGTKVVVLTAPVSGRILRVMQESARMVSAGFPLLEVGDPADLEVRIEVLSRDGVAIQPGANPPTVGLPLGEQVAYWGSLRCRFKEVPLKEVQFEVREYAP